MPPKPKVHVDEIVTLVAAASETPVSLAEAKTHCRVDTSDDDAYITSLIEAATTYCDYQYGILGQAIVTQRWSVSVREPTIDAEEDFTHVHIPVTPTQDIVSMSYYDTNNVSQSLTITDYTLTANGWWAYVSPNTGVDWPTTYDRADAITVTVDCGFGDAADVPATIKHAILLLVCHWYENRESVSAGVQMMSVPMAFDMLIAPHRKVFI